MSILGSLLVELKANTAAFIEGLSGAGKTAKTVGREIEDSFSTLGHTAATALAPLGEMGSVVGEALERVGSAVGSVTSAFAKMGASGGLLAAGGAAAAAALLGVEGGVVGLAIKATLASAELGEMSQKTGISTQTLAGLEAAGRETGVSIETITKSLGFMNANMVKAAIAAPGTKTVFQRLGVDVKDAENNMREGSAVFFDLVGKISTLPAPEQGYFMKAIFGRGGIELMPLLAEGKERLEEMMQLAKNLGLGDPQQVAASMRFKQVIGDLRTEFEAMGVRLSKDLLPTLLYLSSAISEAFKTGAMDNFLDGLASLVKYTLVVGESFYAFGKTWWSIGELFVNVIGNMIEGLRLLGEATEKPWVAFQKSFRERVLALPGEFRSSFSKFKTEAEDIRKMDENFITGVFAPMPALKPLQPHTGQADLEPAKKDTTLERIQERIKALGEEAAEWGKVAQAGTTAGILVAEANKKGSDEFHKLLTEAARDKSGAATSFVTKNEDFIRSAAAAAVYGQAIKSLTSELDKAGEKTKEQTASALALANAYQTGNAAAIAAAVLDEKFASQTAKINDLKKAYDAEVAAHGALTANAQMLSTAIELETAKLDANKEAMRGMLSQTLSTELQKQAEEQQALKPKVDELNAAYFVSEDAIRAARIELELYKWQQGEISKGIDVTADQIKQKRAILKEADDEAYQNSLAQSAAQFDLNRLYDEQIVKLARVREVVQANGASTLLVDARMLDAEIQLTHQWDEAAFKVGTFGEKARGVLNEIVIQGKEAGQKISQAFVSAYDGITTQLAKLLTGQKANFKSVFQGLAEQVGKAEIQKGIGALAEKFGVHIPGLGPKADGSSSNPFHVIVDSGNFGKGGGIAGFHFPSDVLSDLGGGGEQSSGGGGGGGLSLFGGGGGLGSLFGGFFAEGGDMLPGKLHVAGERGPEIIAPKQTLTALPVSKLGGHSTSIVNNFNGFKDTDMFRRSAQQVAAKVHTQLSIAYSRS